MNTHSRGHVYGTYTQPTYLYTSSRPESPRGRLTSRTLPREAVSSQDPRWGVGRWNRTGRKAGGRQSRGGGLGRPCPGVWVHVQAGMRGLGPRGLPEWADSLPGRYCTAIPLGGLRPRPLPARRPRPSMLSVPYREEPCKSVFTATLGLIKGLSVSRLRCEPRTPGHSRGCVLQGRSWARRGLLHPGARSGCLPWDPGHCHPLCPTSRSGYRVAVEHLPAWGTLCSPGRQLLWGLQVGQLHLVFRSTGGPACPRVSGSGFCVTHPAEEETDSKCQRNLAKDVHSFSWGLNLGLLDTRL